LNNYLIPLKNGHLTRVDPKLYTKCPFEVRTHFFSCYHGTEWTASHDAIWNALAFIEKNARFHVLDEQTIFHLLPLSLFIGELTSYYWLLTFAFWQMLHNQSHLSKFGLSSCFILWGGDSSKGRILSQLAFDKYIFPLAIEIFGRLHQQTNNFFHRCASMIWLTNGTNNPPLVVLHAFYKQRMLIALQKA
jgi:hypothetical protein